MQFLRESIGVKNCSNFFYKKTQAFGRGFDHNVKLLVYPANHLETGDIYDLNNFKINDNLKGLLRYLKDNHKLEVFEDFDPKLLHFMSDDVLSKIKANVASWDDDVPTEVVRAIKFYELFGYLNGGCKLAELCHTSRMH